VQVVDDGNEPVTGLRQVVLVGVAIDEDIRRVPWSFEGDLELVVINAKVGDGSMQLMARAQRFGNPQLVGLGLIRRT